MSKDELHAIAEQDTPEHVEVPNTWPGLAVWLVGKFGVGAIFMFMVWFLYQDLKVSNERFSKVTEANTTAFQMLIQRIEGHKDKFDAVVETLHRIETTVSKQ